MPYDNHKRNEGAAVVIGIAVALLAAFLLGVVGGATVTMMLV